MPAAAIRQRSEHSSPNHLEDALETELNRLQKRVLETAKGEFVFDVTTQAKQFLLHVTEQSLGAHHLKIAIENHIVYRLADLFATDQILTGDTVRVDQHQHQAGLTFTSKRKEVAKPRLCSM